MRPPRSLLCALAAVVLPACGSRTPIFLGLAAMDAGVEAAVPPKPDAARDAGIDVHTRPPTDAGPRPHDAGADEVVLYIPAQGATWTWTGTTWAALGDGSETEPPARDVSAMASDGREIVLFGGENDTNNTFLGDTWVFSRGAWAMASPTASPSVRAGHSMAGQGSTVVLFGGRATSPSANVQNDTWVWDGAAWTQAHPAVSPSPRSFASFVSLGNVAILYGGADPNSNLLGDTLSWDGTAWTELTPPTSPPLNGGSAATLGAYVYLFAPTLDATTSAYTTDTWAFDGSTWTNLPSMGLAPPGPTGFGAAAIGNLVLLYGGYFENSDSEEMNEDDTFTWNGTGWTDLGTFTGPDMFSGYPPCLMSTVSH